MNTQRTTKNVSVSKTRLQRMRDFNGVMKSIHAVSVYVHYANGISIVLLPTQIASKTIRQYYTPKDLTRFKLSMKEGERDSFACARGDLHDKHAISFPEPKCLLVSAKTRSSGIIRFQTKRF